MKDKKMFALFMVLVVVVGVYATTIMKDLKEVKNEIASFNVTMSEAKEEREEAGKCGNPVNAYTRVVCGEVVAINEQDNILTLVDEDGETWIVEVGNAKEFDINWYYCIFFDTMGTTDIYDDEVVKLWREVW
jgi:hypothetical protein